MRSGGAEKSLLTLLTLFDYSRYRVDLLCFRHDGLFFKKIPQDVNVIGDSKNYEIFDGDAMTAVKYFLKKGKIFSAADRYKYSKLWSIDDPHKVEELQWKCLKKQLPKLKKHYDCAIGYLEGNANRFVAEKVSAEHKIMYIHNDIEKLGFDYESYKESFSRADKIVTVSEECKNSIMKNFSEYSEKICIIENITSRTLLEKESKESVAYPNKNDCTIINTVGRFSEQKNIFLAVETCAELIARGRRIKWYHIGDGVLREQIEKCILDYGVEDSFILLGEQSEPYPYIGQCDIYVQPSLFEGKSIAVDEAKCLCRPIVVTDFSTVHDQIEDGVNGLICEMNRTDMADKIEALIDNKQERNKLIENLGKEKVGNEEEINKFYDMIDRCESK